MVKLSAVTHSSDEFLRFLNTRELKLGSKLKIKAKEAFDGSMLVSYEKHNAEHLSAMVCEKLLVTKE
jgi:DtxR family Mn-dependent transcriptional regulator